MPEGRPNVLFFHVDNLGFGELSCYSGGPFRGCVTERIDAFAREGFRLTNYCPESQCTPTRSALLTGRYSIRSGTHSVPIGQAGGWGLVAWEKTLGDLLSEAGYGCAAYGKWHVGEGPGRWPTDKGFLEWYGPPRTYDEALWPTDPWYDPQRDPVSRMLESRQGDTDVTEGDQLTLEVRRDCDTDYLRRAESFIRGQVQAGTPFFVYFNHSLMHMPVIPRASSRGVPARATGPTASSNWTSTSPCCCSCSTSWASLQTRWSSSPGTTGPKTYCCGGARPATGKAPTSLAGRATCAPPVWCAGPATSPPGAGSDDIMHVTDWFTTLVAATGARLPQDRIIDGVNQLDWLTGTARESKREGYLYWMGPELYGAKWRNFKLTLVAQKFMTDPPARLATPRLINLITDPQEREPVPLPYLHTWTATHLNKLVTQFQVSTQQEPVIPLGAPLDHVPTSAT